MKQFDVIVIGAGAAGLMAAGVAGNAGDRVLLIEHTDKVGEKIRISGGGRCNFTNINAGPANYLCKNPHFHISALKQYSSADFIKMVEAYKISYHEKTLGQLFCDTSSKAIIEMLKSECSKGKVEILLSCNVRDVSKNTDFEIDTSLGLFHAKKLIIATGGLSIPKLGSTDFGYRIARKFGHKIIQTRPALVPLNASGVELELCRTLSGISQYAVVSYNKHIFKENILFAHFGLTGPAILQISSYIENFTNAILEINMLPDIALLSELTQLKSGKTTVQQALKPYFANKFIDIYLDESIKNKRIADLKKIEFETLANSLHKLKFQITGSEGYAKAEVTAGGVDTDGLSSKTMESKKVPGLFFIGEAADVTGWLGGYNFQWAWSSAFAAATH